MMCQFDSTPNPPGFETQFQRRARLGGYKPPPRFDGPSWHHVCRNCGFTLDTHSPKLEAPCMAPDTCRHRGAVTGEIKCDTCPEGKGPVVQVHECKLHGHCVKELPAAWNGEERLKVCARCRERVNYVIPSLSMATPPATKPLALITINIGHVMHPKSRESMIAAAERWGAEYVEITSPLSDVGGLPHWQKAFLGEYAKSRGFERVVYFDSDVLIRSDCPSIFEFVPREHVGAVTDRDGYGHDRSAGKYSRDRDYWSKKAGVRLEIDDHVNGGLIVFTVQDHAPLLTRWATLGAGVHFGRGVSLADEMALSAVLKKAGALYRLDATWNTHAFRSDWHEPGDMKRFVYHYISRKGSVIDHNWQVRGTLTGRLPITGVVMNWRRPENVRRILDGWIRGGMISEAIVVNNSPSKFAAPPWVNVINYRHNSMYNRFDAMLSATFDAVLMQDDDLVLSPAVIEALFHGWSREPDIIHSLCGRAPRADGTWAQFIDRRNARAPIALPGFCVLGKPLARLFFDRIDEFADLQRGVSPHGRDEDVIMSYIAKLAAGRDHRIYALHEQRLPSPHAISDSADHAARRQLVLDFCETWFREQLSQDRCGARDQPSLTTESES